MVIYSYYYGASAGKGIGVQAQSKELERLPLSADLKSLSSLHALESSERNNEMLSYLLSRGGHAVLGLSYIESPKSSGYSRSAPCGLAYVIPEEGMTGAYAELGKIVNFINFRKPDTAAPAPLAEIPLNDSGYYYHNSVSILAPLVDRLTKIALSQQNEVLLVALPRGKNSEYATARYTIAEALSYLPPSQRRKIRFFTGLPVEDGVTDPQAGYDTAVRFGANVVFCPNEYYKQLKSCRTCLGLDMDAPGGESVGPYAAFITKTPDSASGFLQLQSVLQGGLTYDSLNKAAQKVQRGEVQTIDRALQETRQKYRTLQQQSQSNYDQYQATIDGLQRKIDSQDKQIGNYRRRVEELEEREADRRARKRGGSGLPTGVRIALYTLTTLVLMVITVCVTLLFANKYYNGRFLPVWKDSAKSMEIGDVNETGEPADAEPADETPAKPADEEDDTTSGEPAEEEDTTAASGAPAEETDNDGSVKPADDAGADASGETGGEGQEGSDDGSDSGSDSGTENPGQSAEGTENPDANNGTV